MVGGAAYLILALLLLGGIGFYLVSERNRKLAEIDRRLSAIGVPGAGAIRPALPVSVPDRIAPLLAQAQLEITAPTLRLLGGIALGGALLALILAGPVVTLVLLGLVPLLAHAWVRRRAGKRVDALIEALPHYIDAVRQSQAVGNSLPQALERALADAPQAVQSYFAPAARRLEMGAPVGDTMQQLADRLRIPEISMLAAAVRTNLRYGGSLGTVLRNLAQILRDRQNIKRELRAATSEAKVSSRVLIAMPILAMIMLVAMNPAYIDFFTHDQRGRTLMTAALVLQGGGILVLRRLMRLDF